MTYQRQHTLHQPPTGRVLPQIVQDLAEHGNRFAEQGQEVATVRGGGCTEREGEGLRACGGCLEFGCCGRGPGKNARFQEEQGQDVGEIWEGQGQWLCIDLWMVVLSGWGEGRGGDTGGRILLQLVCAVVEGLQSFGSSVALELEFDAELEDFEAQVWLAGEGEEGLQILVGADCGGDVVSTSHGVTSARSRVDRYAAD